MEEFILNYEVLDNYINEQKNIPWRTDWELTMLRNNCKNNIKDDNWDTPNKINISINHETWDITVNWQNVENLFDTLPTFEMSKKNKIYRQITHALQEARERRIYEQVFEVFETKKKLNNLKDSIENPN